METRITTAFFTSDILPKQNRFRNLSTKILFEVEVEVPWPIFTSVRGASPIQPPLEPDYPCLKTFPADLVTYNLNMKCCAHKL